jgi:hypothetical protein
VLNMDLAKESASLASNQSAGGTGMPTGQKETGQIFKRNKRLHTEKEDNYEGIRQS